MGETDAARLPALDRDAIQQAQEGRRPQRRRVGASISSLCLAVADESRGRVHVHVLPDAGHWVHVDAPEALLALVVAAVPGDLR